MAADAAAVDSRSAANGQPKAGGKVRLLTLDDLDGRTNAARYVREARADIMADLGGEDQLSTLERVAVDNLALLGAMIHDAGVRWLQGHRVDPASITTLQNTFNRTAGALGWQRRAKDVTPDLRDYMAARAAEKDPGV